MLLPNNLRLSKSDAHAGLSPALFALTQKPSVCRLREPLTRYIDQTIEDFRADSCGDDANDEDCEFGRW
jgi:hypothetical protein